MLKHLKTSSEPEMVLQLLTNAKSEVVSTAEANDTA